MKCDPERLKYFLAGLPRQIRSAFEFRHESWFNEEVYAALRNANVALCQAESEKLETPSVQTADFAYLRLRKEKYSPKIQKEIAEQVGNLAKAGVGGASRVCA